MPTGTSTKPAYTARLNSPTTEDVAERLRLTTAARGGSMADHVTAALLAYLPSRAELAEEIRNGARNDIAS